jgi:hypothetical protein
VRTLIRRVKLPTAPQGRKQHKAQPSDIPKLPTPQRVRNVKEVLHEAIFPNEGEKRLVSVPASASAKRQSVSRLACRLRLVFPGAAYPMSLVLEVDLYDERSAGGIGCAQATFVFRLE